jgi:hypothetical protein
MCGDMLKISTLASEEKDIKKLEYLKSWKFNEESFSSSVVQ